MGNIKEILRLELIITGLVSIAYIASFALVEGFLNPVQQLLVPELSGYVSLLFLPHGVRVLAFYFFGLRAYLYLLPSAYLMWYLLHGSVEDFSVWAPLISSVACYLGVQFSQAIARFTEKMRMLRMWTIVVLAGIISSFFNSFGLTLVHAGRLDVFYLLGYALGDILGIIACLAISLSVLRLIREQN